MPLLNRALGAYYGLALGDALGATVEFMTAREIAAKYKIHDEIVGGGWLGLKRGKVTDDTEMALALGSALISSHGWNLRAIADAFVTWMRGRPIDIGNTCRRGIRRYMHEGSLSAEPSEDNGGNGAAMRNLPVILATPDSEALLIERSLAQAHITHHHALSDAATSLFARMTRLLLTGGDMAACERLAEEGIARFPAFAFRPWPGRSSGYIVDTVQTVFDGFFNTRGFKECLVRVVNRGGDADTNGALAGQLAGALYGMEGLPQRWMKRLDPKVKDAIHDQTRKLLELAGQEKNRGGFADSVSALHRCNLPARIIGSEEFQENPSPIEIEGVRQSHSGLFHRLKGMTDAEERRIYFQKYLIEKFGLDPKTGRPRTMHTGYSYLNLLRAWGTDSNGQAGAVLKAWAENRFGIPATYHQGRLGDQTKARELYLQDRMQGTAKSVGVMTQLDLLFTFCQDEMRLRFPGVEVLRLFRGTHDPDEYTIRDPNGPESLLDRTLVRFNNVSSFTSDPEVAWEFGSRAWEVKVPTSKIVFHSGLLSKSILAGESEHLVLGGYYWVKRLRF
ncbi:MAG TPA: ADP-ribosyl-[dinitrogen reductase] hydrolase [Fibrobacteria bacterium]|nr:ADP-ribosyl-[dinitrogen reductase] hydrolase [Fibrobacteria bacterium]